MSHSPPSVCVPDAALPVPPTRTPDMATLIRALQAIARNTAIAQASLSVILGEPVSQPVFVEHVAVTPDQLEAAFDGQHESQNYWVVLRGREPGLYRTVLAADAQTNGVPNEFQRRRTGLANALAFYRDNHPLNVKKLVEEGSWESVWDVVEAEAPAA
ncbi:hypothetical protein C8R46DRAFT_1045519 [Mycena filopes]|nr:hypothetical protein C8R46DRAFT_1234953 [Mycena filopes]KAJ7145497.1 hypothetical protein C8R46DRAFT_1045519 [Mycena filopes]